MSIKDEQDIFALRVDQNNGAYFKAFVGQEFKDKDKKIVRKIVDILYDRNEYMISRRVVYKVIAESPEGTAYLWQEFENCNNVNKIYRDPTLDELEQINQLFEDNESIWG